MTLSKGRLKTENIRIRFAIVTAVSKSQKRRRPSKVRLTKVIYFIINETTAFV